MQPASPIRSRPHLPWSGCGSAPSCRTGSPPPVGTFWWANSARCCVDAPGRGRTVHEAPEIDGIVHLPDDTVAGELVDVVITAAVGPDLFGERRDP